jgi:hypothetical protein
MKPKLVILDANVIIHAHEHGYWAELVRRYFVYVGSVIAVESRFYFDAVGDQIEINLKAMIDKGQVRELEASSLDLARLEERLVSDYLAKLDPGEREVVAYLAARPDEEMFFCTADLAAVKMMSVLDMGSRAISTEKLCDGFYPAKKLHPAYRDEAFQRAKAKGIEEKRIALRKKK